MGKESNRKESIYHAGYKDAINGLPFGWSFQESSISFHNTRMNAYRTGWRDGSYEKKPLSLTLKISSFARHFKTLQQPSYL